jgi:hypothetical protein
MATTNHSRAVDFCGEPAGNVPVYELDFLPDTSVVDTVAAFRPESG